MSIDFDDRLNILIGSNGSGKSNLLDIITLSIRRFLLLSYEVEEKDNKLEITVSSGLRKIDKLLEKSIDDITDSHIEIRIKVDQQDIDNIKVLKKNIKELKEVFKASYSSGFSGFDGLYVDDRLDRLSDLTPEIIVLNQELSFSITNNKLDKLDFYTLEYDYLIYLNSLELCLILAKDIKNIELSPIYLYFSPYRAENTLETQVNLASNNFYELLSEYLEVSSKNTSSIVKLASLYFAEKKKNL